MKLTSEQLRTIIDAVPMVKRDDVLETLAKWDAPRTINAEVLT
jgi:hypothetical protein